MHEKGMTKNMIIHPIPPVYDKNSKILILGSFPSVKSREEGFFYGHPQNRFWRVLSAVFDDELPKTIPEKKKFLLSYGIALWDVLMSCEITGSSDSSIKNVVPTDLSVIFDTADIHSVFLNGKTAEKYFLKYQSAFLRQNTKINSACLPSTSPANAAYSLEKLINAWKIIRC